jgi:lysozyme
VTENYGLTPELISLVKKTEGWVPHPYLCPAGYPTIGWGHVIPSLDHPNLTVEEGEQLLMSDLRSKRDHAVALSPILATEPERRLAAIVDFCYNAGEGNYKLSQLRKAVNLKMWAAAGVQMRKWVWAHDGKTGELIKLASLISRRETCAKWLEA